MRIDAHVKMKGRTAASTTPTAPSTTEGSPHRAATSMTTTTTTHKADQVKLSTGESLTSLAMSIKDPDRAERLHQLTQLVQSGQYHVSAEDLSKKIVSTTIDEKI